MSLKSKGLVPWLLIDYDDTLGGVLIDGKVELNTKAYALAKEKYYGLLDGIGLPIDIIQRMRDALDWHLVNRHGFGDPNRFADAMELAYIAYMTGIADELPDLEIVKQIHRIGQGVFGYRFVALPGALHTMSLLRERFNIGIVTKGNKETQEAKINQSGVGAFACGIQVVERKNSTDWENAISYFAGDHTNVEAVIGDSIPSDVNPALKLGLNAIHVNTHEPHAVFEQGSYTDHKNGQLIVVPQFSDVLQHLNWS